MKTRRGPEALARRLAGLALLLAALPACAFDLPELMGMLAQRPGGETRFTEERTVSGLDAPLRASGTLSFTAPDRFARHTLQPRAESMEVQGNTVTLRRGSRVQQMQLDAVPELAALADALRGTLTGDARTLQKNFRVEVSGNRARWLMTLTPSERRLSTYIRTLEIGGDQADVRSIDLRLPSGDRSLMLVEPLVPTRTTAPTPPAASSP
jgi:outer membrane lipoprotein-sorting protein